MVAVTVALCPSCRVIVSLTVLPGSSVASSVPKSSASDRSASIATDRRPRPAAIPGGSGRRSTCRRCLAGPSCTSPPGHSPSAPAMTTPPRAARRSSRPSSRPACRRGSDRRPGTMRESLHRSRPTAETAARRDRDTRRPAVRELPARGEPSHGIPPRPTGGRLALSRLTAAAPEREVRERSKEVDQTEQPPARLRPTDESRRSPLDVSLGRDQQSQLHRREHDNPRLPPAREPGEPHPRSTHGYRAAFSRVSCDAISPAKPSIASQSRQSPSGA